MQNIHSHQHQPAISKLSWIVFNFFLVINCFNELYKRSYNISRILLALFGFLHEERQQIDRQGEHNCWILLGRNRIQSLGFDNERKLNYHHKSFVFLCAFVQDEKLTWRYRSWRAAGLSPIISDASRNAREAFCSPSDAMIFARASRDASAY